MELILLTFVADIAAISMTTEMLRRRSILVKRWYEGNITMKEIQYLKRQKWFYYKRKNDRIHLSDSKKNN